LQYEDLDLDLDLNFEDLTTSLCFAMNYELFYFVLFLLASVSAVSAWLSCLTVCFTTFILQLLTLANKYNTIKCNATYLLTSETSEFILYNMTVALNLA